MGRQFHSLSKHIFTSDKNPVILCIGLYAFKLEVIFGRKRFPE
ncbi:hypothetical protein B4088_6613 [Bacillus cereus]|uniref:Uncharacterized protein n=1 Tax=Bacillus cereus TaxID=1396 RepID=A0A164K8I7_BACCE|nr:hypothetical protein B4088_6613 [Bacillus cereus]